MNDDKLPGELVDTVTSLYERVTACERKLGLLAKDMAKARTANPPPDTSIGAIMGYKVDTPVGKRLFRAFSKAGKYEDVFREHSALLAEYDQMLGSPR